MGIIKKLSYEDSIKIAAGEVIDRPSSVIRELIDNSIDANADEIYIETNDGGKTYIEVIDNGKGMDEEDLKLCYHNHTTSKINTYDDLNNLKTLGFRGEALASIAEVSNLIIHSNDGSGGNILEVEYGKFKSIKPKPRQKGTSVIVKNIFENLPARKKFLSSDVIELRYIEREIIKKIIAYPEIGLKFINNGKERLKLFKVNSYIERILSYYTELKDNLIPIENITDNISIYGYISKPSYYKNNRNYEFLYVNKRPVEWKNFYIVINNVYKDILPQGYYPAIFIFLEISSDLVDFNVHPMKKEVRFKDENEVKYILEKTIENGLKNYSGISKDEYSSIEFNKFEKQISNAICDYIINNRNNSESKESILKANNNYQNDKKNINNNEDLFKEENKDLLLKNSRYIGCLFGVFLLFEKDECLIIFDQHAAHERINYEKLKKSKNESIIESQILMNPVIVNVSSLLYDYLIENLDRLNALGFDIELFGNNSFIVRSVPVFIDYNDVEKVIISYLESIIDGKNQNISEKYDNALKEISCKVSVKSGDRLTNEEVMALINEWEKTDNKHTCPHGRPVYYIMKKDFIYDLFKRKGF